MRIELHIDYFEEDNSIVALCRELQVSSFGDTLEQAENSIKEAIDLFLEGCESLGTLDEVLQESGFKKDEDMWIPRQPIKSTKTTLHRSAGTVSYA